MATTSLGNRLLGIGCDTLTTFTPTESLSITRFYGTIGLIRLELISARGEQRFTINGTTTKKCTQAFSLDLSLVRTNLHQEIWQWVKLHAQKAIYDTLIALIRVTPLQKHHQLSATPDIYSSYKDSLSVTHCHPSVAKMPDSTPPTLIPDSDLNTSDQTVPGLGKSFQGYRETQVLDSDSDPGQVGDSSTMASSKMQKGKGKEKADQSDRSDQASKTPPTTISQTPLEGQPVLTAHDYRTQQDIMTKLVTLATANQERLRYSTGSPYGPQPRAFIKMPPPGSPGAPTFNGCNITYFLDKYEALAGLAGYPDQEKATALPWYLPEEHQATVKSKASTHTWAQLKEYLLETYGPLDEEVILQPNRRIKDLLQGPLIRDDDLTTTAELFQKVESIREKARAQAKPVMLAQELIELFAKRYTQETIQMVALQMGMTPADLFERGNFSSFKKHMLAWIGQKTRYRHHYGDSDTMTVSVPVTAQASVPKTKTGSDQGNTTVKGVLGTADVHISADPVAELSQKLEALAMMIKGNIRGQNAISYPPAAARNYNVAGTDGQPRLWSPAPTLPASFSRPGFVGGNPDQCWYDGCDSKRYWKCPQLREDKLAGLVSLDRDIYKYGRLTGPNVEVDEVPDAVIMDGRRQYSPDRVTILRHLANNTIFPESAQAARRVLDQSVGRPWQAEIRSQRPQGPQDARVNLVRCVPDCATTHADIFLTNEARINAMTRSQATQPRTLLRHPDQAKPHTVRQGYVSKNRSRRNSNASTGGDVENMDIDQRRQPTHFSHSGPATYPDQDRQQRLVAQQSPRNGSQQPTPPSSPYSNPDPSRDNGLERVPDQDEIDERAASAQAVAKKFGGNISIPLDVALRVWPQFKKDTMIAIREILDGNGFSDVYPEAPAHLIREVKPQERQEAERILAAYNKSLPGLSAGQAKVMMTRAIDLQAIKSIVPAFMMPHFVLDVRVGGSRPDQNERIRAIIDNGSQTNIVSKSYALKHGLKLTSTRLGMKTFNPAVPQTNFQGVAVVPVWVEGYCILTSMFVADDDQMSDPLLLGGPFCLHSKINFSYGDDLITVILSSGNTRLHIPAAFINFNNPGSLSEYIPAWDQYAAELDGTLPDQGRQHVVSEN